ncbi:MAG: hypothetical protein ACR2KQ_11355 [Actinomycetota bacterium]
MKAAIALAAMLLLSGCGDPQTSSTAGGQKPVADPSQPDSAQQEPSDHERDSDLESPPPVRISYAGGSAELEPWTFCFGNGCADGEPPAELHDVGEPAKVRVDYPLQDWSFEASFKEAGKECGGRVQTVPLQEQPDGSFLLRPAGYARTYDVTLMGRGNGDLFVTFRWTTPQDGPLPEPGARLAVLADHDGEMDSYGIELELLHLDRSYRDAAAAITVTSSEGRSLTFDAKHEERHRCLTEGSLYWDGPDDQGLAAAKLGSPPFVYEVVVTLAGSTYRAEATWPQDMIEGNEPSVALNFDPQLPNLR